MDTETVCFPPSAELVSQVLGRVPGWTTATAVHLATPREVMVGPDVWRETGAWHWRGASLHLPKALSARQCAAEVCSWVAGLARPGDRWAALDASDPSSWVKSRRSGTYRVFYGMSHLNAPYLSSDAGIPEGVAHRAAGALVARSVPVPSVIASRGVSCLLDGSGEAMRLHLVGVASAAVEDPW